MSKLIKRYKNIRFEPNGKTVRITIYRSYDSVNHKFTVSSYNDISASSAIRLQRLILRYEPAINVAYLPVISLSFFPNKTIKQIMKANYLCGYIK